MCKPEFTKALKNLTIKDGETLTLSCSVQGDPEPQVTHHVLRKMDDDNLQLIYFQITWSKNGKAISSSEIMDLKYKNGVATLTINEVFPEDEGVYTCTATNSIGSTETSSKLTIQRK